MNAEGNFHENALALELRKINFDKPRLEIKRVADRL